MNMGYEEEELLPFKEPILNISDQKRIDTLVTMGYSRPDVEDSLRSHKFDDCYASYLLLGRKSTDVSKSFLKISLYEVQNGRWDIFKYQNHIIIVTMFFLPIHSVLFSHIFK
jgi:hypothetical protein